jgi:hypothetical protein
VFARVAPEHKLRPVEMLKEQGEIVAVTGDGINDAPALKRADVGVAMGQRGSDVAREVADVVLIDDNFATIVAAIEEGRNIYENIQKFIRFFFSTDLALILLMTAGLGLAFVLGMKDPQGATFLLPLTAVQLLWINFVADGPRWRWRSTATPTSCSARRERPTPASSTAPRCASLPSARRPRRALVSASSRPCRSLAIPSRRRGRPCSCTSPSCSWCLPILRAGSALRPLRTNGCIGGLDGGRAAVVDPRGGTAAHAARPCSSQGHDHCIDHGLGPAHLAVDRATLGLECREDHFRSRV